MAPGRESQQPTNNAAVASITPKKSRPLRRQHHDAMLQAAKDALELGVRNNVNIHIFGAPYKTKVGMKGTRGSRDAVGKFDKNGKDQTGLALAQWTGKYLAANPCIRLDYSGLVAIDVDHGLEGLSDEQMIAKADVNGLPRTYTVRTGRANGGATFLYRGSRTLPDVQGFQVGELSGDIKHHGHIAAAGSLHKSGNVYRRINDLPFTALPGFWRDYKHTKKAKPAPLTPFEEDCLRKDDLMRNPDTSPLGLARKRAYDYEVRLRERLIAGEVVKVKHGELIPKGRRVNYLTQQAGRMRKLGLDPEIIRIALDIRAIRKCWDGENFILSHKSNLDYVAGLSAGWDEGDYIMPTLKLDGRVIHTKPPGRHDHLVAVMKKFPDEIAAAEGYDLLEREVAGTRFRLTADRKPASRQ